MNKRWLLTVILGLTAVALTSAGAFAVEQAVVTATNMNVRIENAQEGAAVGYLKGFLGGDIEKLYKYEVFPVSTDSILSLIWTRLVTHPYTRWRWDYATIEKIAVQGDKVTVEGTIPTMAVPKTLKNLPKVVQEMKMYRLIMRGAKITYEPFKRELMVSPTGKLKISASQIDQIKKGCISEALTALRWVQKNKKYSLDILPLLTATWEQHEASTTVKLLPEVTQEWGKTIEAGGNSK